MDTTYELFLRCETAAARVLELANVEENAYLKTRLVEAANTCVREAAAQKLRLRLMKRLPPFRRYERSDSGDPWSLPQETSEYATFKRLGKEAIDSGSHCLAWRVIADPKPVGSGLEFALSSPDALVDFAEKQSDVAIALKQTFPGIPSCDDPKAFLGFQRLAGNAKVFEIGKRIGSSHGSLDPERIRREAREATDLLRQCHHDVRAAIRTGSLLFSDA